MRDDQAAVEKLFNKARKLHKAKIPVRQGVMLITANHGEGDEVLLYARGTRNMKKITDMMIDDADAVEKEVITGKDSLDAALDKLFNQAVDEMIEETDDPDVKRFLGKLSGASESRNEET